MFEIIFNHHLSPKPLAPNLPPMASSSYSIEKLIPDGLGLSRDQDGKITLLEGVIPGETVTATIHSQGPKFCKGVAKAITHPSPERIPPPCPYYKQCGGCDLQHMSYPAQLQGKHDIIKNLLKESGNKALRKAAEDLLQPLLPSPQQLHYRQRIRLQIDAGQTLGFHRRRSHSCIPIKQCLLARPEINDSLQALVAQPILRKLLRLCQSLEILSDPESSHSTILLHYKQRPRPTDLQQAQELTAAIPLLKDIFFYGEGFAVTGHNDLSFTLPPLPPHTDRALLLSLESGGFCQVNVVQNTALVKTVLDFCAIGKDESVLDLFCGMGNFSLPLAEKAQTVLGIEGQGSAIRSAKKNSAKSGQGNTRFLKKPIHAACSELAQSGKSFDCVVMDPPRQGVPGLARMLAALCQKRLVYVSCDPTTLCRDLTDLVQHGFSIQELRPIDMFPQTHHCETVSLLVKS